MDINQFIVPLFFILGTLITYIILKRIIISALSFNFKKIAIDKKKETTITKVILNILKYLLILINIIMILEKIGIDTSAFLASMGIAGVVIGLSIQDTVKDFLSGVTILFDNYFNIGDTITVNGFRGEVIDFSLKTTKLKAYTGEIMILANHMITNVINFSLSDSLAMVDVSVGYNENVEEITQYLEKLCVDMTEKINYLTDEIKIMGLNELAESSVIFRLAVTTQPTKNFEVQREMLKNIKINFDRDNINIPFPIMEVISGK